MPAFDTANFTTDVLIIGSGGAGLRAAIEVYDAGLECIVVGKCAKREAHTKWAQGGINAALGNSDPADSWQMHAADTIVDGGMINNTKAVELVCEHAPAAIKELDDWGCPFNKDNDDKIMQRFFGAASYPRACFSGDSTGLAILNTLVDQVDKRSIPIHENIYITSLLQADGQINGAVGINFGDGTLHTYHAKAVVLATGGHSRMFARSSSLFWENNGDGIKLALDAGASFADMEMFQFHPTGFVWPEEISGELVTEAVRGEGGILTNNEGERYMERYAPDKLELSARDVVARANFMEIAAGRGTENGGVYLDISHRSKEYLQERLPGMLEKFQQFCNIDISEEKMEVAPTAHYSMGGVLMDHVTGEVLRGNGEAIPGLYAVGEIGAGVHGGNRLGGNSLAEIVVFGRLTGQHIAGAIADDTPLNQATVDEATEMITSMITEEGEDPIEAKKELQQLMWNHVGVVRNGQTMQTGLDQLHQFDRPLKTGTSLTGNQTLVAALDVRNALPTCQMILESALIRTESRAAHYRTDYLETDPEWQKNIICSPSDDGFTLTTRPVEPPSDEVAKLIGQRGDLDIHLLE